MALRYGSKNGSALRYNPYSALALRYGSKIGWTSGGGIEDNTDIATPAEYFTFTLLDDGTYSIKAADVTNMPANVILPNMYEGKRVTKIEDVAFMDANTFTGSTFESVIIPNGITSIGGRAFGKCQNLTSVVIPDSVTSMGDCVFSNCSNLTSVVISNRITSLGFSTFSDCASLIDVIIPDSVTSIGIMAFYNCTSLTRIVIPDKVTSIGRQAFQGCSNLTICCEAFGKLSGWDNTWNSSNCPVFWGCSSITTDESFTYTLLDNDTYSIKAADKNNMPEAVVIPSTYNGKAVTAIEMLAFNDTTISKLYIHEGITSIGYSAFAGCTNLVEVHLPASLTSIGEQAFNGCSSLAKVTIADNSQLVSIGGYAFNGCSALTSIIIPESVTTIGEYAFRNCSNLTINCEVLLAYKPSGWATTWASGVGTVNWGYTG